MRGVSGLLYWICPVGLGGPLKVSRHSLQARLRCAVDGKLTQNRLNSGPHVFKNRDKLKVFIHLAPLIWTIHTFRGRA